MRLAAVKQTEAASRPKDHLSNAGDEDLRRATAAVNAGSTAQNV
jgi:hypothetical protein